MGDFLAHIAEFIAEIWRADSQVRDQSLLGESKMERRSPAIGCVNLWWHNFAPVLGRLGMVVVTRKL